MTTINSSIPEVKTYFFEELSKGKIIDLEALKDFSNSNNILEYNLLGKWYSNINGLSFLNFDRKNLEEVFIHGPRNIVYKTKLQSINDESDITQEDLQASLEVLALEEGISWNYKCPFASFDISHKKKHLRVTLIHFSLTPNKLSKCFIRILNSRPIDLNQFDGDYDLELMKNLVKERKNILIAGSTGSGKTTYINSLLTNIPKDDHLVILEDVSEISPPNNRTTKLIADNTSPEKSLNAYMSYALRMSPDRIVLGEIRAKEVESYLLAMNTGHNGLLSTVHANSAKDAVERLALLFKIYSSQDLSYELVLKLVCNNIDTVVFLDNKKVVEIINLFGSEKEQIFFESII